jgi:diacylglycerol O-acyltransferase
MGSYDRLTLPDRLFLDVEDPLNNMHIAGCFIFDAGPLSREGLGVDIDEICAYLESRLHRIPRYRQRIEYTPIEGHPVWVDDENFNILYHVRHTRLPLPGDERQLKRLCGRIVSQQLDRHKPLWEMWVVEGLEHDRIALVTKVHHCMADGISGVDLLEALLQPTPDKTFEPAPAWVPQAPPDRSELARDTLVLRAQAAFDMAGSLWSGARDLRNSISRVGETLEGVAELRALDANPASETPINRRLGPHRRYDWLAFDLDEVKRVRALLGGTINDVVLSTVAGAFGRFFERRGITAAEQRQMEFRTACPVSTRSAHERGSFGNQVAMMIAPLPISERDPVRIHAQVREALKRAKDSKQTLVMQALSDYGEWISPSFVTGFARRAMARRSSNLVVTNVPGPRVPLYLLGAQMREAYPVVPLPPEQAIGIALFSYGDGLFWGINSDWDLVPDLHDFVEAIDVSFRELCRAADAVEAAEEPVAAEA